MKYTWEEEDIEAGVLVAPRNRPHMFNMISQAGYSNQDRWQLVSLNEGLIAPGVFSAKELADHLNKIPFVPLFEED